MDRSLVEILQELSITIEIRSTVLQHEREMGRVLDSVVAFERGDQSKVTKIGLDQSVIQEAFLCAVAWGHTEAKSAA